MFLPANICITSSVIRLGQEVQGNKPRKHANTQVTPHKHRGGVPRGCPPHLASLSACAMRMCTSLVRYAPCLTYAVHRDCAVCRARYAWRYDGRFDGMGKTSVYLTSDLAARVKAAGVPLSELVRRGLDAHLAPDLDTVLGMLRAELGRTAVSTTSPHPLAAASPAHVRARSEDERHAQHMPEPSASACTHPRARVHKGLCGACGQHAA